jgi:hypothetical protein
MRGMPFYWRRDADVASWSRAKKREDEEYCARNVGDFWCFDGGLSVGP